MLFVGLRDVVVGGLRLAASYRRKTGSSESRIKYFVLGGFSSAAFFLTGIALIYGAVGSTNITDMVATLSTTIPVDRNDALILAGTALMLVGLGFKIAVPFHVWTPDVYQARRRRSRH